MKKLLAIALILLTGCSVDPIYEDLMDTSIVPEALFIEDFQGIKLEKYIVEEEVNINAKLPSTGSYKIRIIDFTNKVVSQDIIEGKAGDNILKIYVRTLETSSYTVELKTIDNKLVGLETFSKQ